VGVITVAAGGGGIPVVREENGDLTGVAAVIDKDRATALLGRLIGADTLVLITSVNCVYEKFGQPDQKPLNRLDISLAERLLAQGEFPPGSMGPKIESALSFLSGGGHEVIITSPDSILAAIDGRAGTRMVAS
jgi:carbamate kinase